MTSIDVEERTTGCGEPAARKLAVAVTGAGSGLGRALVVALAAKGHEVLLVGRRADRLAETARSCLRAGSRRSTTVEIVGDVADPVTGGLVVATALERFGRLDAIVNNAAVAWFGELESGDMREWERLVRINLLGPAELVRSAAPALRATHGVVVNVGSIGGCLSLPGRSIYGASKAALHHLTRSLAKELAPEIRVNAVVPGAIDTELYEHTGLDPVETARLQDDLVRTTPLGRMGTPDDVVPWIEMLLGPDGRWVTGSLFVVDGGRSC